MKSIAKVCKNLLIEEPFYGYFLLNLNKKFSDKLPTAGVYIEGINTALAINPDFWEKLSDDHRFGLLKHELLHICFYHLELRKDYGDAQLFNLAADIQINQYIKSEKLPNGALTLTTYPTIKLEAKKGTHYYYEMLQKNLQKPKKPQAGNGSSDKDNEGEGQMANGELQDGDSGSNKSQQDASNGELQPSQGMGAPNSGQGTPKDGNYRDEVLDRMMQKPKHVSWDWFDKLSDSEKKLVRSQIEHSLKETAKQVKKTIGSLPGELKNMIDELFEVKEQVFNWKAYFRRFLGVSQEIYTKKTRRKLSKRFFGNPGLKIKKKKHILFAVDTSGSMSVKELTEAFNEVRYVQKAGADVTIIECDAAIGDIYKYNGKFRGHVTGGGGTSFEPVIDYYNKNKHLYTTLVYFTDGWGSSSVKAHNKMMWVISSNGDDRYVKDLTGYIIKIPQAV